MLFIGKGSRLNGDYFSQPKTFIVILKLLKCLTVLKIKYNEVNVTGPDNERVYTMNVVVNNEVMGEGTGRTKKAAEQMAAYQALKKLRK